MAWTWTYTDPSASNNDAVRFECGDTDSQKPLVYNEEITYALTKEGSVLKAAARICEHLAAKFAREEQLRTSTFTTDRTSISKKYREMAQRLRVRASGVGSTTAGFVCPSLSIADKGTYSNDSDSDLPPSFFQRGMHNNTETEPDTVILGD